MLNSKIALITGSSKGIGKAIAIEFAKSGADVIVNYNKDEKGALEAVGEIKKIGRKSVAIKADVGKFEEVTTMIDKLKKDFGRIDILVNNAGIAMDRTLKKMTQEEWNTVINVNLNSLYNVTHQILPLIPEGGRIINLSSIVGLTGNFGQTNYAATKAGIIGFTKSLAKELGRRKITVNVIAPGFIEGEMVDKIPFVRKQIIMSLIPLGRAGLKEEVANCTVFLASDKSSYITGEVIGVSGGLGL